jgi:transposase InsO family protein
MEHERKRALARVTLTAPDVMRGLDGMHLLGADGALHALFIADAAVPYRTHVQTSQRYDAQLVARAIRSDIESNGAPLVYRLDRASPHDSPAVLELLAAYRVLVLHGPPRCPRFYGQHERQNREHRAWEDELALLPFDEIEPCLEEILEAVNKLWRRRALNWRTPYEVWSARARLDVDRDALREEVKERAFRINRTMNRRGKPADLAERLAIEQALQARGYLRKEVGGWC